MLSLARHIPAASLSVREGAWDRHRFMGMEMYGKTLGIVGLGRIGHRLGIRARAFSMDVVAHDPFVRADGVVASELRAPLLSLPELLARSDFVSCHMALTPETEHLFDHAAFAAMRPTAYLVNAARGGVVDETALIRALREGRIAGAALDVREVEPPGTSPLNAMENVILTPHIAALTAEAQERAVASLCRDVAVVLRGETPAHMAPEGALNAVATRVARCYLARDTGDFPTRDGGACTLPSKFTQAAARGRDECAHRAQLGVPMRRLACVLIFLLAHSADALPRNMRRHGPRLGFNVASGDLTLPYDARGIAPIAGVAGWHFEFAMASASNESVAVVFEQVPLLGGWDQDLLTPTLSLVLGVRTRVGLEVGAGLTFIGPTFLVAASKWESHDVIKSTHATFALGWNLRAGRLNFPVNLAYTPSRSPGRQGAWTTLTVGVNWSMLD